MTTYPISTRLIFVGGFALAVAVAPALALARPMNSVPVAACHSGEAKDVFTVSCTPVLVPNSPQGFTTTAANPDIPELGGIPCTGHNTGPCIGVFREQQAAGPQPVPHSTISASP
jgi:hypothetical protein